MRFLRLLAAALMGLAILVMGFFVAAFLLLAGALAAVVQAVRGGGRRRTPAPGARPAGPAAGGDVIDIEATRVESRRELV